ncbi:MAG: alkaline phosphatase family protein [Bacteroidaceae bacterium]|nr:alkaline phosphatase family protein [Bacteroidaceae bacterium]
MLMSLVGAEAQTAPEVPRLVVNVVIDQLRSDYMEAFSPLYGEGGFRRLLSQGRVYSHAEYPFASPDRASAVACLMSGTVPYENGIVAERWLDRSTLQPVGCVDDPTYAGHNTSEHTSPANLAVSTITDELKVSTEGRAMVYAVAPNRDAAVFLAGHAADGAFWLSDQTGQWATSAYYSVPSWLSYYNQSSHAAATMDKCIWEPINDLVGQFNYFVSGGQRKPFRHAFKGDQRFRQFKASALVNEEVTDFVSHCLQNVLLGIDPVTDFLSVGYYAGNFDHRTVAECPMELQDTYVRLDEQLARLIRIVEDKVGRGRVLFVVTGTGYSDAEQTDDDLSRYRIPSGEFHIARAQLLLNMYLSAVYGQGQYVEACMGNHLYFDLKYIEKKGINLGELLERSADFLIQLSGVRDVYTSQRLAQGAWTPGIRDLRNAYNPKCSGDIMIQVAPGWRLVNEQTHERILQRETYMGFPLYFYGLDLAPEVVEEPVSVDRVAPTLARCMRIRAPNACSAAPLTGIR